jgi:hypothetical protein
MDTEPSLVLKSNTFELATERALLAGCDFQLTKSKRPVITVTGKTAFLKMFIHLILKMKK